MKKHLVQLSLLFSTLLHIILAIALVKGYYSSYIPSKFVVLGAHSQKPTQAYYKSVPQHYTNQTQSTTASASPTKKTKKLAVKSFQKKKKEKRLKNPLKIKKKQKSQKKKKSQKLTKNKNFNKKKTKKKPPNKATPKKKQLAQQETHSKKQTSQQRPTESSATPTNMLQHMARNKYSKKHLHYFRMIQEEVTRVWQPPVGIPKGVECTVLFSIGSDGIVKHFELIKRSNMLLYDLSITQAAQDLRFNKSLWGRQFTISFRQ